MEDQKKNSLLDDDLSLEELAKNFDNIDINDLEKIQDLAKLQQQMNDFLIDRFATNIEAFKKYMPDIGKFFYLRLNVFSISTSKLFSGL